MDTQVSELKNKKLFAGPFVGEFGWELFCWQGYIRYLSRNQFDHTTVVCMSGHSALYEDFADEIIEYSPDEYSPNCQFNKGKMTNIPEPPEGTSKYISPNTTEAPSYTPCNGSFDFKFPQIFTTYKGNRPDVSFDILIHARSRKHSGQVNSQDRNMSQEKWDEVVNYLTSKNYSVASIGTLDSSMYIKSTKDLRGISLSKLIDYMSHSKTILGPSSGPLHLQALCAKPVIVWSGDINNKYRYQTAWNPFGAPVKYLNGWSNVKIEHIKSAIDDI